MKAEWVQPSSHLSRECELAVSACLAGIPCRYDGASKEIAGVRELVASGRAVCLCPECMGGLPVPRPASEIVSGDGFDVLDGRAYVLSKKGDDLTQAFLAGAKSVLQFLRENGIGDILLCRKSPSCGVHTIYDGTFSGSLRNGPGVTAALLIRNGMQVREE